jgi:hypothetical protein
MQSEAPEEGVWAKIDSLHNDDPLAAARGAVNGMLWGAILWAVILWMML